MEVNLFVVVADELNCVKFLLVGFHRSNRQSTKDSSKSSGTLKTILKVHVKPLKEPNRGESSRTTTTTTPSETPSTSDCPDFSLGSQRNKKRAKNKAELKSMPDIEVSPNVPKSKQKTTSNNSKSNKSKPNSPDKESRKSCPKPREESEADTDDKEEEEDQAIDKKSGKTAAEKFSDDMNSWWNEVTKAKDDIYKEFSRQTKEHITALEETLADEAKKAARTFKKTLRSRLRKNSRDQDNAMKQTGETHRTKWRKQIDKDIKDAEDEAVQEESKLNQEQTALTKHLSDMRKSAMTELTNKVKHQTTVALKGVLDLEENVVSNQNKLLRAEAENELLKHQVLTIASKNALAAKKEVTEMMQKQVLKAEKSANDAKNSNKCSAIVSEIVEKEERLLNAMARAAQAKLKAQSKELLVRVESAGLVTNDLKEMIKTQDKLITDLLLQHFKVDLPKIEAVQKMFDNDSEQGALETARLLAQHALELVQQQDAHEAEKKRLNEELEKTNQRLRQMGLLQGI